MRGWILVGTFCLLTVASAGAAVWVLLVQLAVPLLGALTGGEIWLPLPMALAYWLLFGGAVVAFVFALTLSYATLAVPSIPVLGEPDALSIWTGVALGAAAAAPFHSSIAGWALTVGIAVLAGVLAVRALREFISDLREGADEVDRREWLREHGERFVAEVTAVDFQNSWWLGGPEFEVEAEYDGPDGKRSVRGEIVTSVADAPIVGGTVVVRVDPNAPESFLLDRHRKSIRDPDAAKKYASPDV
ncbi:DUF3592 domain-containing protein [Nocardia australiensis]|uniref:DUF3592 domain-containing protein n=1 Tax=Nocardia australiensis TaxID=2887191 RepID=UPI001D14CA1F|nr:DUF3592 domain-containing protein [Nocardia australiensis]